jgi:hypothetical protein
MCVSVTLVLLWQVAVVKTMPDAEARGEKKGAARSWHEALAVIDQLSLFGNRFVAYNLQNNRILPPTAKLRPSVVGCAGFYSAQVHSHAAITWRYQYCTPTELRMYPAPVVLIALLYEIWDRL